MDIEKQLQEIIQAYNAHVQGIEEKARSSTNRSYGGVIRAGKGKLQEYITETLAQIAWQYVGGNPDSLEINSKKISIPIRNEYISRIKDQEIKKYIQKNITDYVYKLSVDKHIFIDGRFVIGIECKAYAENAMLKRILVDFDLLKMQYPDLSCYLFQLESQLGGDYHLLENSVYGSHSTHTIQSYFSCNLNIVTFLAGERKIDRPIHKYFKPLKIEILRDVVETLAEDMRRFL